MCFRALTNPSPLGLDAWAKTQTLLGSSGFKSLSRPDQKLVTETLAGAKDLSAVAGSCQSLLADPWLQDLKPAKKTAVLSQARNYPDPRSVRESRASSCRRAGSGDPRSRTCSAAPPKPLACLSQHPGDRGVIENTLDQILSPGAKVKLSWRELDDSYGEAGLNRMRLNEKLLQCPTTIPLTEAFDENRLVVHTVAHEVNHPPLARRHFPAPHLQVSPRGVSTGPGTSAHWPSTGARRRIRRPWTAGAFSSFRAVGITRAPGRKRLKKMAQAAKIFACFSVPGDGARRSMMSN
jgi:hypothetical protein